MYFIFTKTSKFILPLAILCSAFFSTNGYGQTTIIPVTSDTICFGDTVKLAASSSKGSMVTFAWADTSGANTVSPGTGDTVSVFPSVSTNYRVIGDSSGTKDTTYFMITVNALPTVVATASKDSVCVGDSIMLTGAGAKTYVWDNGAMDSVKMPILVSTVFNVIGTDANGCKGKDSAKVVVKTSPTITALTNDSVLCKGDSTMLWAMGGTGYIWSSNQGMTPTMKDTVKVAPSSNTTFYVLATGSNSCKGIDSIKIMLVADPIVKMTLSDTTPCFRDTVWFFGSGAKTYTWGSTFKDPMGTGDTILDIALSSRKYWVTGVDSNGCMGRDTAVTIVQATPREQVQGYVGGFSLGTNSQVCTDELLTVKANHGRNSYTWGPSGTVTPTTGSQTTLNVTAPTIVTVKIDSSNGCFTKLNISYFPSTNKPSLTVTWKSDSVICVGDTANIIVAGAVNYTWTPSASVVDPTASDAKLIPTVTTTYTVKGLQSGCTGERMVKVTVNPLPNISLSQSSNGNTLCADEADTITISSNNGILFDWGFGVLSQDKIKSILPGKTTTITITAVSSEGCKKAAQITINVDTTCGVRVGTEELITNSDIKTYLVSGGELHLQFGNVPSGNVEVEIINLTGATAKRFNLGEINSSDERIMNVSELPKGIYLLKVKGKNFEIVNKIMR